MGVVTIGDGHTQNVKPTDVLKNKKEADDLLVLDVRENANYIRKILKSWKDKKNPGYMVTQGQLFLPTVPLGIHFLFLIYSIMRISKME